MAGNSALPGWLAWLKLHAESVAAGVMAAFGVFWMIASLRQEYFVDTPHVSLSFMPFVAGALLTVLGGYLVFRPSRDNAEIDADSGLEMTVAIEEETRDEGGAADLGEAADETAGAGEAAAPIGNAALRVALAFVALIVYGIVLTHVHSLLSTFALVAVALALAGEPIRLKLLVIAAVVAAVLYAIFMLWLGVPLPGGRFT